MRYRDLHTLRSETVARLTGDPTFADVPVNLVAWTSAEWRIPLARGLPAGWRLIPVETASTVVRALRESVAATVLVLDDLRGVKAMEASIPRRFPLFQIALLPDRSGRDPLHQANLAAALGALLLPHPRGEGAATFREAGTSAQLMSPAGLVLGRLADRLVNLSPLLARYLVLCLTVNSGATTPCQLSRSLGVSLRKLEREMQEEQVPGPLRMALLARLLRVAWLMQSEDHCLTTVASALGFSYPAVVSRLLRSAGFTARSMREQGSLGAVLDVVTERWPARAPLWRPSSETLE